MADKQINELPAAPILTDDALILVYIPGSSSPAQVLTGKQFRAFAEAAAETQAGRAEDAAERAETAAVHQPYPNIETGTWWKWNAEAGQYEDTGLSYSGTAGFSPAVKVVKANGVATITITTATGDTVFKINDGANGVSVESITLKSSTAAGNTYAVALSDGTSYEITAPAGPKGDAFTYDDFTSEQLAALKGEKGDAFTFADFTPEQLAALKGEKGDPFTYVDFTSEQLAALKGEKGDAFTYEDFTPEQLKALKGEKGDAFTYADFTPEQLEALRGPAGTSVQSVVRTAGNGAPGTTDTYTVTMTDGSTSTFQVYNGKDGEGAGDMTAGVYDPQGKKTDVFQYMDDAITRLRQEFENALIVRAEGET